MTKLVIKPFAFALQLENFPLGSWDMTPAAGGGGVCTVAPLSANAAAFGGLPADVAGQVVSKAITAPAEQGQYLAITDPAPMWADGVRVIEGRSTVFTGNPGAAQNSLAIASADGSKVLLAGFIGGGWVFQLLAGFTIIASTYVAAPLSAVPALAVDATSRHCTAYLDGVPVTSGPFAPGGMAEGFMTGPAWRLVGAIAFQSNPAEGDMRLVTSSDDMAFTYAGAADWCGNIIGGGEAALPADAEPGRIYEITVAGTYQGQAFVVGDWVAVKLNNSVKKIPLV